MLKPEIARIIAVALLFVTGCPPSLDHTRARADVPAFPGAEGFGAQTPGGRGGKVIEVTNLNPDGPGSLREALSAQGPRIVVFRTGGTIHLRTVLPIRNPYITIAGQTAPGDGICIRGAGIIVSTHDVVIRGLRIRVGDDPDGPVAGNRDGIQLSGRDKARDVIIDHCSISWGIDENVGVNIAREVTFQYNIISEGLNNSIHPKGAHSKGMLLSKTGTERITVHHNLFAHNVERNPLVSGRSAVVANNVVYDYKRDGTQVDPDTWADIIGNHYISGPSTLGRGTARERKGIRVQETNLATSDPGDLKLFVSGNIGVGRMSNTGDDWEAVDGDLKWKSDAPLLRNEVPLTLHPVEEVLEIVLSHAGATSPHRDRVDQRVIKNVRARSGKIIDSPSDVGGWPEYSSGAPPPDNDQDGMPDSWEKERGLNPADPSDANADRDADGYTNIEEYINSLLPLPPSAAR